MALVFLFSHALSPVCSNRLHTSWLIYSSYPCSSAYPAYVSYRHATVPGWFEVFPGFRVKATVPVILFPFVILKFLPRFQSPVIFTHVTFRRTHAAPTICSIRYGEYRTLAFPPCPGNRSALSGNFSRRMIGRPVWHENRTASKISAHALTGGLITPSALYFSSFFIDVT